MSDRLGRLTAPVTGVAFIALMLIGIALSGSTPDSKAGGARVIAFYEAHRSDQKTADIMFVFAALFVVFFAGALRRFLRSSPAAEGASAVILAGGVLLAVGLTVLAGTDWALADVPGRLAPSAAQALNVVSNDVFYTLPVGGCAFGIASAAAILRGAALPSWLGWTAAVIGVVMATPALWVGGVALFVWILVVSALIYLRTGSTQVATALTPAG